MNTRNVVTGFFLVVSVVGQGAIALSRAGESSVTVLARGPAGLRIEGKSSQIDFEEDASALTFKVPIAPIETGIGLPTATCARPLRRTNSQPPSSGSRAPS